MADKKPANNVNIMRAMQANGVFALDNRIPKNVADHIDQVYERLLNYAPTRNSFMSALLGQMVQGEIETVIFRSPLGVLKKDPMRYGAVEQEIFINMIKGFPYDEYAGVDVLYGYYEQQVMAAYHTLTPPIQYRSTFTYQNLRDAFLSEYGIRDMIKGKVASMFSSAQYDEYINTKALLESAYNNGNVYAVTIPSQLTKDNAEELTIQMKNYITRMRFPNPAWNITGAASVSLPNSIYYMTTPEYDSFLDVKVLATAYNMGKVSVDAQKIIVDRFTNPAIKAAIFDLRWFKIRDRFQVLSSSDNGASLKWNYFLTNSEMFSYSPFFNMIVFTTDPQGTITITTEGTTGSPGSTTQILYNVEAADGYAFQAVDYMVTGNTSNHTFIIPGTNTLKIGEDEKASTISVQITSRIDPSITATATVTVS